MELTALKIILLIVSTLTRLFFGFLPLPLIKFLPLHFKKVQLPKILKFFLYFGGGVLLATCFLHVLPEVREYTGLYSPDTEFPLADAIFLSGFFFVYLLEEFMHKIFTNFRSRPSLDQNQDEGNGREGEGSSVDSSRTQVVSEGSESGTRSIGVGSANAKSRRGTLAVISMSFHGIFEGMAIGMEPKEEHVWLVFGTISVHDYIVLFCIGVELTQAQVGIQENVVHILVVSLMEPVGIGLGILVYDEIFDNSDSNHALLVGSLQGLAAGTLMYMTFLEIFTVKVGKLETKLIYILGAILGFVLIACLIPITIKHHQIF